VVQDSYECAVEATGGFTEVDEQSLYNALLQEPSTLRTFRLLLGLTWPELAATTAGLADEFDTRAIGKDTVKAIEAGRRPTSPQARLLAAVIDRAMTDTLFPAAPGNTRNKLQSSYSAGVSAGGSHAPVVKSWRRASSLSSPHLVAVSR